MIRMKWALSLSALATVLGFFVSPIMPPSARAASAETPAAEQGDQMDINTAMADQLKTLPGPKENPSPSDLRADQIQNHGQAEMSRLGSEHIGSLHSWRNTM